MARVSTDHGSFDVPDGWTLMPGLGGAGCTPEELSNPTSVHPSMIATGDERTGEQTPSDYVAVQLAALEKILPGWRSIDGNVSDAEPGPAVVRHSFQAPEEGWVVQFQAYWFLGARVSIVTMTVPAALLHAAWDDFLRAVASFEAPSAPSAA